MVAEIIELIQMWMLLFFIGSGMFTWGAAGLIFDRR